MRFVFNFRTKKRAELSEAARLKQEETRKAEVLSSIDINNYAGM